jgi:hypothetical protein
MSHPDYNPSASDQDDSTAATADSGTGRPSTEPVNPVADAPPTSNSTGEVSRSLVLSRFMAIVAECWPESPFRSFDWRWRLASVIHDKTLPLRWRRRDPWLRAVGKYLDRLDAPRRHLPRQLAAIEEAHRIWSCGDPRNRLELEIRLLSGQSYADVARYCGIDAAIVEAYERVFYNVTDSLEAVAYMTRILDPSLSVLYGTPDLDTVARLVAHRLGPAVVEHLLAYMGLRSSAGLDPGLDRALRRLLTILRVPLGETTASGWFRLNAIISRHESQVKGESAAPVFTPIVITSELPADMPGRLAVVSTGAVDETETQKPALDGAPAPFSRRPALMATG